MPPSFFDEDPGFTPPKKKRREFLFPEEQDTPLLDRYAEMLNNAPQPEGFHNSFGRKLAAALIGASEGLNRGGAAGFDASQHFLKAPYEDALTNYTRQLAPVQAGAGLEEKRLGAHNTFLKDYNAAVGDEFAVTHGERMADIASEREKNEDARLRKSEADAAAKEEHTKTSEKQRDRQLDIMSKRVDAANAKGSSDKDWHFDPETGETIKVVNGKTLYKSPSATAQEIIDQSNAVSDFADEIAAKIDANKEHLGPAKGRVEQLKRVVGVKHPAVKELYTDMESLKAMLTKVHGGRFGVQAQRIFDKAMGSLEQDPENTKASLRALKDLTTKVIKERTPGSRTSIKDRAEKEAPASIEDIKKKHGINY